jgi:hypothetical protein
MVFTDGTIIMHKKAVGHSREEIVRQVVEKDPSVKQYVEYVPIGESSETLHRWIENGAAITYITSRKGAEVNVIRDVLQRHNFPKGQFEFRREGEEYQNVVERVIPDVLVEDDCKSIGGEAEMIYPNIRSDLKPLIRSVVVKEFEGMDHLPDDPYLF